MAEDFDIRPHGHHGEHQQGRHGHHRGRQLKDEGVGLGRDDILLGQQLDRVGDGLQQTENARPVGAQPDLEACQQFALQPDEVTGREQQHAEHHPYFYQQDYESKQPGHC